MRLTKVYVRFYKSFNYDYERKAKATRKEPWEDLEGAWYPFVRMDLDEAVTTVVGANESGKSHLLDAIEKVITGEGIERADFCRYSSFFSVENGKMRKPDFGAEFEIVSERDAANAREQLNLTLAKGQRFTLFRLNGGEPVVYHSGQAEPVALEPDAIAALPSVLPAVFRLNERLALPASIPLYALSQDARRPMGYVGAWKRAQSILFDRTWASEAELTPQVPQLFAALRDGEREPMVEEQYQIGRDLILLVADIDKLAFGDLDEALVEGRQGYVEGVIQKVNHALARHLNFPRWWAQDRDFSLRVSSRDMDLVFTIHDRTGTDYSFGERSQGLKYFLSYYVQLLARKHRTPADGQAQILLMDEPDAYLSSQGQQDLLRILENFARPEDGSRSDQVVYVTHSPFLINRNAAHRIRVLDKGVGEEGTRVVKDAARNHYEPLRSSLGAFVAETAFIGGANLFVEGLADQVLLAGMSSHLRAGGIASKIDSLDLNTVTIVPSGSAESISYMVFLARGRDEVKPPCVALFDGDDAGKKGVALVRKGGNRGRRLLDEDYVVELDVWASGAGLDLGPGVVVREPEDLIALPVAVQAARGYARDVLRLPEAEVDNLREKDLQAALASNGGQVWDAVRTAFAARYVDEHIEKVGFAKQVVSYLGSFRGRARPAGAPATEANFRLLLTELSTRLRRATEFEDSHRRDNRLKRVLDKFLTDHPGGTTRDEGRILVDEIERALDDSNEADRVRSAMSALRRNYKLDEDLTLAIDRFEEFRAAVNALRYAGRFGNQEVDETDEGSSPAPAPRKRSTRPAEADALAQSKPNEPTPVG